MKKTNSSISSKSDLLMVLFTLSILLFLFIPVPSWLLDFLLIINLSWAFTILLLTFYTDKPLSFSTFPTLLLLSTLFRLALNVSATRLILADGEAGKVIQAIGQSVIQENYVMGLVVFLILIIIQYLVVTNGSQRVAEVAARFTLDSMPGKQMSIDADLNMGLISQTEAKQKRCLIEKEANFYGSMDGASKFVKGDAIAGILIILVDIIGGFAIGLVQRGLSLSESIHRYTMLTVGDGLVTQIPALIISTATGIIVTRAATDAQLGNEITKQFAAYPKSLIMVCFGLLGLLLLKGMPILPLFIILAIFAFAAWFILKNKKNENAEEVEVNLYEKMKIHPLEVHLNPELCTQFASYESQIFTTIQLLREHLAYDLGFVIPDLKILNDKKLNFPFYSIKVQGNSTGLHQLHFDKLLALSSGSSQKLKSIKKAIAVRDPSYGLPALWINPDQKTQAMDEGYTLCDPLMVFTTHFKEVVCSQLAELLTRKEIEILLEQPTIRDLRDELIPNLLSLGNLQRIFQNLLEEKVSIRALSLILEVLLDHAKNINDPLQLTEIVRNQLGTSICQKLMMNQSALYVLTLGPKLEQTLNQSRQKEPWALEPSLTEQFIRAVAKQVEQMIGERKRPILLCSSALRRPIKLLTQRVIPHLVVLAMSEVPINIPVESFAVIQ